MSGRPASHYAVLGVRRDASAEDISAAYRLLAMSLRPNHKPGDEASEAEFARVHEAYEVLSDPEARARYDASLAAPAVAETATEPEEEAAGALDPMADAPEDPDDALFRTMSRLTAILGVLAATRGAIGVFCAPHGLAWSLANRVLDLSTDQCLLLMVIGFGVTALGLLGAFKFADPYGGFLFRDGKPHPPPPRSRASRNWPF